MNQETLGQLEDTDEGLEMTAVSDDEFEIKNIGTYTQEILVTNADYEREYEPNHLIL